MREESVLDGARRADLIVLWDSNRAVHVEVKVGDESFEKTVETGKGCRERYPSRSGWVDYVLLPEESLQVLSDTPGSKPVIAVTWTDLAIALPESSASA